MSLTKIFHFVLVRLYERQVRLPDKIQVFDAKGGARRGFHLQADLFLLCWFLLLTSVTSMSPLPVRPHRDTRKAGFPILVVTAALPGELLKCWTKNLCPRKSHIPDHVEQVLLHSPQQYRQLIPWNKIWQLLLISSVLWWHQLKHWSPLGA